MTKWRIKKGLWIAHSSYRLVLDKVYLQPLVSKSLHSGISLCFHGMISRSETWPSLRYFWMLSCRISTCRRCPLKYQPNRLLLSTLIGSTDLGGFFKCKKCYNKAKMFLQWWDMEMPARVFSLIISELHFARSRVALFNTEASHASVMDGSLAFGILCWT